MAHLALLHDPDAARRRRFAHGVRELFAQLPETATGEVSAGPVTCLWAGGLRAPVDLDHDDDRFALLIGYAIDDAGRWLAARDLADRWLPDTAADAAPQASAFDDAACDGYHVAAVWDPRRGLAAGVDPLGLFPLYHAALPGGVSLVATTPEAFVCHADFPWQIDRLGLAGILLAHGLLANRPLLSGCRRLPMGHMLHACPAGPLKERRIFALDPVPPPSGETVASACERVEAELLAALRRHRPPGDESLLMLSGGSIPG